MRCKNEHGRAVLLGPEQKNENVLMDQITKYKKPGNVVMDMFAGTFSTFRSFLSIDNISVLLVATCMTLVCSCPCN